MRKGVESQKSWCLAFNIVNVTLDDYIGSLNFPMHGINAGKLGCSY